MAENLESAQAPGSGAAPTATPSTGEGASSSGAGSQEQVTLDKLNEKLNRVFGEINALKSGKDKGIDAVKKEVSDVREKLARYEKLKAKGMSAEEAMEEIEHGSSLQEQIKAMQETVNSLVAGNASGTRGAGPQLAAQAFSMLGLDPHDPDVAIAISEVSEKTPAEIKLAAFEYRERKANKPNPTRAQAASVTENSPPTPNTDALRAEYDKEAVKFRGNAQAIAILKAEYRKKGLSIW